MFKYLYILIAFILFGSCVFGQDEQALSEYEILTRTIEEKQDSLSIIAQKTLKEWISQYWHLKKKYEGSKVAAKAVVDAYELARKYSDFEAMDSLYSGVSIHEQAMADLAKYISEHISQERQVNRTEILNELIRIRNESRSPEVQAAVVLEIALFHSSYGENGQAALWLDSLATKFNITKEHKKYGKQIQHIQREMSVRALGRRMDDFKVLDIEGNLITSNDLKGKVVLLYFYGSGCGACIKMYPVLNKMYRQHIDHNFFLLGISTDGNFYTEREFRNRIKKYDIQWPQTLDDSLFDRYGVSFLSTVFLLNKETQIVLTSRGKEILQSKKRLQGKSLEEAVRQLVES